MAENQEDYQVKYQRYLEKIGATPTKIIKERKIGSNSEIHQKQEEDMDFGRVTVVRQQVSDVMVPAMAQLGNYQRISAQGAEDNTNGCVEGLQECESPSCGKIEAFFSQFQNADNALDNIQLPKVQETSVPTRACSSGGPGMKGAGLKQEEPHLGEADGRGNEGGERVEAELEKEWRQNYKSEEGIQREYPMDDSIQPLIEEEEKISQIQNNHNLKIEENYIVMDQSNRSLQVNQIQNQQDLQFDQQSLSTDSRDPENQSNQSQPQENLQLQQQPPLPLEPDKSLANLYQELDDMEHPDHTPHPPSNCQNSFDFLPLLIEQEPPRPDPATEAPPLLPTANHRNLTDLAPLRAPSEPRPPAQMHSANPPGALPPQSHSRNRLTNLFDDFVGIIQRKIVKINWKKCSFLRRRLNKKRRVLRQSSLK